MGKIKVIVTDYVEPDLKREEKQFEESNVDFSYYQLKHATPEEIIKKSADADILVVNMAKIDKRIIENLKNCKLIIRHGVGYDNIDVKSASERGIVVSYIPDYCTEEVAEQAIMLIFACQRKIIRQVSILKESARKGRWHFRSINPVYKIDGKTLGIVGFGRIGSTVYKRLQGFNLQFMIADPFLSEERKKKFGIKKLYSLEEVLKKSDIVTIHSSLSEETLHLIGKKELSLMKKTAILINTSRGGIVNLAELDEALKENKISCAGIDVYEKEPPGKDFPLLDNDKAILTPHLSWLSEEAGWNIREKIVEDIKRYLNRQQPAHTANGLKIDFDKNYT
jgi:D-3-phosphoglycerate dehydrogenase / 2-oxoglutarate reductase